MLFFSHFISEFKNNGPLAVISHIPNCNAQVLEERKEW